MSSPPLPLFPFFLGIFRCCDPCKMEKLTEDHPALHFKLSMSYDATSESYDEAQFIYMPQLDSNRDRALIDILPDYLVDEITFPRPHAAKFYSRMMKALTERV